MIALILRFLVAFWKIGSHKVESISSGDMFGTSSIGIFFVSISSLNLELDLRLKIIDRTFCEYFFKSEWNIL